MLTPHSTVKSITGVQCYRHTRNNLRRERGAQAELLAEADRTRRHEALARFGQISETPVRAVRFPAGVAERHHDSMRELVYLSERKLQQFILGRPRRWRGRTQVEGELKVPGIGGVKLGPVAPDQSEKATPDLEKVISALENSDRAAKWFADDNVQPGQWVHFDVPLCYTPLSDGHGVRAVVFLGSDEPTKDHPADGTTRLLLHGSAEHLLGGTVESSASRDSSRNPTRYTEIRLFARLLYRLNRSSASSDGEPDAEGMNLLGGKILEMEVPQVIQLLDDLLEPRLTAAWMAGYARVTAVLHDENSTTVLATPLYVEYAPPSPPINQ